MKNWPPDVILSLIISFVYHLTPLTIFMEAIVITVAELLGASGEIP